MTAAGADATRPGHGAGHWAGRPWRAVRRLSNRTSLRTKLVVAMLALVIAALAAIGFVAVSILRGYMLQQYDGMLQAAGNSQQIYQCVEDYLNGNADCHANLDIYWLPAGGQAKPVWTLQPNAYYGSQQAQGPDWLPNLSGTTGWLASHAGQPTTVSAQAGSERWRVMGFSVNVTNVPNGAQTSGTIIVATDVTNIYSTIRKLVWTDLAVSAAIVVVLAIVGFGVVRSNLQPLVEIEETAEEIAEGHLNRRVPERDPRTEIGSLGRSLNTMLSQIEAAFHAREESEAAAHHSEERMRRFIADASHELRTPLTAIRGFAEYYRQRGGMVSHWDRAETAGAGAAGAPAPGHGMTPDDLDRIMQRVEKEAARMGVLVEDLLLLARLDQQRPLARQPVDLLSLAADAVHDARLLSPARSIELSVQPGAAFLIEGDEVRLRQVIGNLMSNALTHTPDGTPIEVTIGSGILDPRVSDSPPAVIVDVTDHGPGMTSEQAHRVFERFYRADQARTRATGGSGLGLAIVSALVSAHGGVASVRTAPGRGATFRIALPLAVEAQGGLPEEDEAEAFGVMEEPDITAGADDASVTYGTEVEVRGDPAGADQGDAAVEGDAAEDDSARLSHQS
ncbi:MAG: HAMP domain-containing sensor histidine kinase [Streptosporangiaceae bacterium]